MTQNRRWLAAGCAVVLFVLLAWRTAEQLPVWQNSVTLFSRAVEVAPEGAVNQHNLGYALAEVGRFDEAIPHYEAALHTDPTLYKADFNLGRALYNEGHVAEAIAHFERALKNPMQREYESDIRNSLGIAFARQSDFGRAQQEFTKAIQLRPDSSELYANLGSCLATQGQLDEAVGQYEKAIALNPSAVQPHRNLGHALQELGRKDAALLEFQSVLRLDPGNADARQQVASLSVR